MAVADAQFSGRSALGVGVTLEQVTCRRGATLALDDVSLAVAPGEHVAITGPNGAGKSSLLRSVLGLVPSGGTIVVDGQVASSPNAWRARRRSIAWVPQRPAVGRFPLLVRELLASSGHLDASMAAAERLGVDHLAGRPLHGLSGGQLQRVYLARGLGQVASGAGVLLADEPTSALDFATREVVAELLREVPVTSVVVTHDSDVVAGAHRVLEMAAGSIREWPW